MVEQELSRFEVGHLTRSGLEPEHLAHRLGMTVEELLNRVSSAELTEWRAHDELTAWEQEQASKKGR